MIRIQSEHVMEPVDFLFGTCMPSSRELEADSRRAESRVRKLERSTTDISQDCIDSGEDKQSKGDE